MEQNMMLAEDAATATDMEILAPRQHGPRRLALAALLASALLGAVASIAWPGSPALATFEKWASLAECKNLDTGGQKNRVNEGCEFWDKWSLHGFPDRCRKGGNTEYYDDSDFSALAMCCACGGGSDPSPTPAPPPTPKPTPKPTWPRKDENGKVCEDLDKGAENRVGETCKFWNQWVDHGFPDRCRSGGYTEYYDDSDFSALAMCCACDGGSVPVPQPVPEPTPPPPPNCPPDVAIGAHYKNGRVKKIVHDHCYPIGLNGVHECGQVTVIAYKTQDCTGKKYPKGKCAGGTAVQSWLSGDVWKSYKLSTCSECKDLDDQGQTNLVGETCAFWNMWRLDGYPDRCKNSGNADYYDDSDFSALSMCCACGGGNQP